MKTIVISITVPDGVQVQVSGGVVPPDDFEHEPLPTETFADAQEFVGGPPVSAPPPMAPPPTNGGVTPFRGAAMQHPGPTGAVWQVGAVHEQGHKPLKAGQRGGVFCPTKLGEDAGGKGVWCQFKA